MSDATKHDPHHPDAADKRERETGDYVSHVPHGADEDAMQDKELKDTFPASDPVGQKVITGFVAEDVTEETVEGDAKAAARDATETLPKQG